MTNIDRAVDTLASRGKLGMHTLPKIDKIIAKLKAGKLTEQEACNKIARL